MVHPVFWNWQLCLLSTAWILQFLWKMLCRDLTEAWCFHNRRTHSLSQKDTQHMWGIIIIPNLCTWFVDKVWFATLPFLPVLIQHKEFTQVWSPSTSSMCTLLIFFFFQRSTALNGTLALGYPSPLPAQNLPLYHSLLRSYSYLFLFIQPVP